MTLPNFLIIGAAKSGTTALYAYLKQHPEVYMSPIKEPKFFAVEGESVDFQGPGDQETIGDNTINDINIYTTLFNGVKSEKAIGEASPWYLYYPKSAERIQHYIPDVKLIVILRNPVERAFSSFLHTVRDRREPITDFSRALLQEETRINDNWELIWHYKKAGFYYEQLQRYYCRFRRSQIRVYLDEDLKTKAHGTFQDICQFLGIDDQFLPDMSVKHNVSFVPKNKAFHTFLTQSNPIKSVISAFLPTSVSTRIGNNLRDMNTTRPELSPEVRQQLNELYREDILKLQDLIERDLSHWMT